MSRGLLGLRVLARKERGQIHGVARVRYMDGHAYAGTYEVELRDGDSFLAPVDTCTAGPNWDVTPEEGRFTGGEFFRPKFLAGATVQDADLFRRGHGVVVPSDLSMLRDLVADAQAGQTVGWYSHGCNEFRGDLVIESVDATGMRLKGGKGSHPRTCTWPVTSEAEIGPQYAREFLVDGRELRFRQVAPKRYGRSVTDSFTLTFERMGTL